MSIIKTNVRQTYVRYGGFEMVAQVAPSYYPRTQMRVSGASARGLGKHNPQQQVKLRIVDEKYLQEIGEALPVSPLSLEMQNPSEDNLARFIAEMPDWINQSNSAETIDFPRKSVFLRDSKKRDGSVTTSLPAFEEEKSVTELIESSVVNADGQKNTTAKKIFNIAGRVVATSMLVLLLAVGGFTVGTIAVSYENHSEPAQVSQQPIVLVD